MTKYTTEVLKGERQARVRITGPGVKITAATVHYADLDALGGPERATVGWTSIGHQEPELAEAVGDALRMAARLAKASDQQPLGFSPRHTGGVETKVRVDTPEAAELCAEHEAKAANAHTREEGRRGVFFLYHGAKYDWNLGEPVYNLGLGARVLYRVPESKISLVEQTQLA